MFYIILLLLFDKKAWSRQYSQIHKERIYRRHRIWAKDNPDKMSIATRRYRKNNRGRIIDFGGRMVWLTFNIRTGQCSKCKVRVGEGIKLTNIHHAKGYYAIFPWYGIEELCVRCHRQAHAN